MPFPSELMERIKLALPIFKPPDFLERRKQITVIKPSLWPSLEMKRVENHDVKRVVVLCVSTPHSECSPWKASASSALSVLCPREWWVVGGWRGHSFLLGSVDPQIDKDTCLLSLSSIQQQSFHRQGQDLSYSATSLYTLARP